MALDQVSSWQTQSWHLHAVHPPHITHPCNFVMLLLAFGNSTVVDAVTLLLCSNNNNNNLLCSETSLLEKI